MTQKNNEVARKKPGGSFWHGQHGILAASYAKGLHEAGYSYQRIAFILHKNGLTVKAMPYSGPSIKSAIEGLGDNAIEVNISDLSSSPTEAAKPKKSRTSLKLAPAAAKSDSKGVPASQLVGMLTR